MTHLRGGKFVSQIWGESTYLVVSWSMVDDPMRPRVEFTVSRPSVGPQGTQEDPLVDGVVTLGRAEFQTLGSLPCWLHRERVLLFQAIDEAVVKAKRELDQNTDWGLVDAGD